LPHEIAAISPVKPPPGLRTSTIAQ
jgi:hypothetical protein